MLVNLVIPRLRAEELKLAGENLKPAVGKLKLTEQSKSPPKKFYASLVTLYFLCPYIVLMAC